MTIPIFDTNRSIVNIVGYNIYHKTKNKLICLNDSAIFNQTYLRNAKEIILSVGTCAHLYVPYLKSESKLYFMTNVLTDQGITIDNLNIDYNEKSDIVQRFFPINTEVCFYNYAPHFDARVTKNNYYKGKCMLDFLK